MQHRTFAIRLVCTVAFAQFATPCAALADDIAGIRLPTVRRFGRATTIGNRVYLFGGGVKSIDIFDTKELDWSNSVPDCDSSTELYGDEIHGKLFLLDGQSRRFVRFDPKSNTTKLLRRIPSRRVVSTVVAVGDKMFVIGGYSKGITKENCVAVYDPDTDRWSNGVPLPDYQPRDHFHSAAVLNGKLHVVGGLLKGNKNQPHWRLDGDHWTPLAEAPLHAMWKHAALVAVANELYLLSPEATKPNNQRSTDKNNFFRYTPKSNQWLPVEPAPNTISGSHIIPAVIGNKIYIFGRNNSRAVHVFDVSAQRWE